MGRLFYFAYLINSIGSVAMWLLLGPFVGQLETGLSGVGLLGMARQIAFVLGGIVGGAIADQGRPLLKQFWVEAFQLGSALVLFAVTAFLPSSTIQFYVGWTALRFFLSGLSFVLGFKLISSFSGRLGGSAVQHLVLTQGATLFAPVVSALLSRFVAAPMKAVVLFDALTTAAYMLVLWVSRGSDIGESRVVTRPLPLRCLNAVLGIWRSDLRRVSLLYLGALVSISGFVVISMNLSFRQRSLPVESAYSVASLIYGIALWLTAPILKRARFPERWVGFGALILLSASILDFSVAGEFGIWSSYTLYAVAFWLLLHGSNRVVLDQVEASLAGLVRGSMVFYLGLVFGLSEWLLGFALSETSASWVLLCLRITAGTFVVFLLRLSRAEGRLETITA